MPKAPGHKRKLLELARLLLERTDEYHPMTTAEVIEALELREITAERKSIYDDMEQLRLCGLDVQCRKGSHPGWFIGQRQFELAELKLLVDAAQAQERSAHRQAGGSGLRLPGPAAPAPGLCGRPGQDHERKHLLQRG